MTPKDVRVVPRPEFDREECTAGRGRATMLGSVLFAALLIALATLIALLVAGGGGLR